MINVIRNKMSDHEFIVRFFFSSGESLAVRYSKEKFEDVRKMLAKGWNACAITGETFGINFSQVTHYEVRD